MATKKKTTKRPPRMDFNEAAFAAVYGRGEAKPEPTPIPRRKNPQAVQLGRRGGIASAKGRNERLSPERRREIAAAAARARWQKRKS